MKKLNIVFIFLLLVSLNYTGKIIVNFVSGRSLYNFTINLITGLAFAVLILTILKIRSFKNLYIFYSLFISQGIIFYFLFTQPRLFDKILLLGFYLSGIFLVALNRKKSVLNFILIILLFPLLFEAAGLILFDRNFLFLTVLKNSIVLTSGYITGLFVLKS